LAESNQSTRIGRIVGAFGLRGEVKVEPLTDFWERFHKGSRLLLNGNWVTVQSYREHKGRPLITLSGVPDATAAEKLQWEYLEGVALERSELDEDEFFTEDLIGLKVVSTEGLELGVVEDVMESPAHDILVVGDSLIPAVKEFVTDVDLDNGVLTIKTIPGLIAGDGLGVVADGNPE
jgi:16S rRNA processing protein RimM